MLFRSYLSKRSNEPPNRKKKQSLRKTKSHSLTNPIGLLPSRIDRASRKERKRKAIERTSEEQEDLQGSGELLEHENQSGALLSKNV